VSLVRVMGLDVGEKRIGVSLSDPLLMTAQPVTTLQYDRMETACRQLGEMARAKEVTLVVVGLPRRTDGTCGPEVDAVRSFVRVLERFVDSRIVQWDERYSTQQAERVLMQDGMYRQERKAVVDKLASSIILQSYLDSLSPQDKQCLKRSGGDRGGS